MTDFVDPDEMVEIQKFIQELCELDHGLIGFEMDFIQNLSEWDGCFTEPQADYLRKIHERHY